MKHGGEMLHAAGIVIVVLLFGWMYAAVVPDELQSWFVMLNLITWSVAALARFWRQLS